MWHEIGFTIKKAKRFSFTELLNTLIMFKQKTACRTLSKKIGSTVSIYNWKAYISKLLNKVKQEKR